MRSLFVQPSSGQKILLGLETGMGKEEDGDFFKRGWASAALRGVLRGFECQTAGFAFVFRWSFFGSASSFSTSLTGSPVEAFSTSPPSSSAISVRRRFETTDRGRDSETSSSDAKASRCLMRSQEGFFDEPQPFVRTRTHDPLSFSP